MESQSNRGSVIMGAVLIVIGILLLFDGLSIFKIISWIWHFWPVALIALGLYMVMGNRRGENMATAARNNPEAVPPQGEGQLYRDAILGDIRLTLPAQGFNGGAAKIMVGSLVIDASLVALEPGEHRLYLRSGVGDVHVDLMPGMAVQVKAQVTLGDIKIFDQKADGFNQELVYQTPHYAEASARLLIICHVGLGDIKVF
jgi:lia operon protein LiaF